jgi:hypothetical protein
MSTRSDLNLHTNPPDFRPVGASLGNLAGVGTVEAPDELIVHSGALDVRAVRDHVLERILTAEPGADPYRHLYVEQVFPDRFYEALRGHMLAAKADRRVEDRRQDNPLFTTARFNLAICDDPVIAAFRSVFSDPEVIASLAAKFFVDPASVSGSGLVIHDEFEYTFTQGGRFQNIHVDIPPKYLSFVFYIPETSDLTEDDELQNATILYGDDLRPQPRARFRKNTACIFAPHFRSYHGFASTINRDVLVMFYINPAELLTWRNMRAAEGDIAPFEGIRDLIEDKLRRHPLIEFGSDEAVLRREREACRINAPQGRVLREEP